MSSSDSDRRQYSRVQASPGQLGLAIKYPTADGLTVTAARLIEFDKLGVRVEVPCLLPTDANVEIFGEIEGAAGRQRLQRRAVVVRCTEAVNGKFQAGLKFETEPASAAPQTPAAPAADEPANYYEVLELSRNASSETIDRVYRILAKRYHPDNPETGNPDLFREIVEAVRVLSDPQLRAAYDARLASKDQNRIRIFENWQSSRGIEAEKRKRRAVLALLYGQRMTDPEHASLSMRDLEQMLDCPREHIQFTLWFLKESKFIKGTDSARFEITHQGALAAEEQPADLHPALPQLTAGHPENKQ